jgi:DNA-directed RNA polymerase sigma subunit (sigma70/sigma32)
MPDIKKKSVKKSVKNTVKKPVKTKTTKKIKPVEKSDRLDITEDDLYSVPHEDPNQSTDDYEKIESIDEAIFLKSDDLTKRSFSKHTDSSISWYLDQINKIKLLTREEEDTLARAARDGDKEAKNMIVKANLRFVVSIAKKYQSSGISLLDLINEGNLGLIKAAEKFDPDRGFHFISYAVWWIRQAIILAISHKTAS